MLFTMWIDSTIEVDTIASLWVRADIKCWKKWHESDFKCRAGTKWEQQFKELIAFIISKKFSNATEFKQTRY